MDVFARFEKVLADGVSEQAAAGLAPEATAGERASHLGDSLYRLCIEHGLDWNGFRAACITAFAGPAPILIGREGGSPQPFAMALSPHHPLLLLALEVMPPDPEFDTEEG